MSRNYDVFALAAAALCGCASTSQGGGNNGDGGGSGSAPPFTNGVSTLAGSSDAAFVDGDRDVARFSNPVNVAYGPDGNVYVADFDNGKIRVVRADGTTSTLIQQTNFARPFGLVFADANTLYCTTDSNGQAQHVPGKTGSIWKIDIGAQQATEIIDSIGMPRGIALLADGRLALADYENHVVELLDPATAALTTIAGTFGAPGYADGVGTAARFSVPLGIVQRSDGSLVVADEMNNRLRVVSLTGAVTTLAGTGQSGYADGAMTTGMFSQPEAIAIDKSGTLYVTDLGNYRVRRIKGTTIDTIAGDGTAGYMDSDDDLSAEFFGLEGLSVKPDGSMVYVADGSRGNPAPYNRVRQIELP
ncbi:MAG TPA: hypothetical protein VMJ10_04860 [Kofleriaceae bacterium]|nr:hypothetical protein [Kofleriaceae bacterium]